MNENSLSMLRDAWRPRWETVGVDPPRRLVANGVLRKSEQVLEVDHRFVRAPSMRAISGYYAALRNEIASKGGHGAWRKGLPA
jgi:hypothetical protein